MNMHVMKTLIALILSAAACVAQAETKQSDTETAKRSVVGQIIAKIDLARLLDQQLGGLIALMQGQAPMVVNEAGIPPAQRERATQIVAAEFGNLRSDMTKMAIDITTQAYMSTFTLGELNELLAFYDTPAGKKLATELPRLQTEGMKRGNEEGKKMGQQALCRAFATFKSEGIQATKPPFC
jgi:uncharacterized protein